MGGQSLPSMSAARRAAEAAFAGATRQPAPSRETKVIVRSARLVRRAETPQVTDGMSAPTQPASRAPRVFRIDGTGATFQPEVPATEAAPRSRRVASDRRPGPVLHVVHAVPPSPDVASMTVAQLKTVIAELALVEPVLALIQRAQAFRAIDDRFAREWLRLARRADAIQGKLRARLR